MAKNKVLVDLWRESGCSKEEANISWTPINFRIYSNLFSDMIYEAIENWLGENELPEEKGYELILHHITEHDGGGAMTDEHFEILYVDTDNGFSRSFD